MLSMVGDVLLFGADDDYVVMMIRIFIMVIITSDDV